MNARETQALLRGSTQPARMVAAGRPERVRRARVWLRLAAYLVDWLVMVIIASVLVSIGGLQLYLASDRGTQDPPDASVYTFLAISSLALPLWLVMTLAGWAMAGRSVGKLATGLRIVDGRGRRPGALRSLIRLGVYVAENALLVIAPGAVALWLAADGELPRWYLPVAGVLILGALATLVPALLSAGGRALHDLAAGTTVVEE